MPIYQSIDPKIVSEVLSVFYDNYIFPDDTENNKDENTCIFKFMDSIELILWKNKQELVINLNNNKSQIRFSHVTRIITQPKLKYVIFESKFETGYSQLRIDSEGKFQIDLMRNIEDYQHNWGDLSEEALVASCN